MIWEEGKSGGNWAMGATARREASPRDTRVVLMRKPHYGPKTTKI